MLKSDKFNFATFFVYLGIAALIIKLLISPNFDDVEGDVYEDKSISYICDFVILCCCFFNVRLVHKNFYFIFQMFFILLFTFTIATVAADGNILDSLKSLLRLFIPLLFFSVVCSYFYHRRSDLIVVCKILLVVIVTLTIVGLALLPPSVNRFQGDNDGLWWPAYFNGVHTTTYIVIAACFIVFSMYRIGAVSRAFAIISMLVSFFAVAFGWGVRTTTLSMIVLVLTSLYYSYVAHSYYGKSSVKVSLVLISILYGYLIFDWDTVNALSSGRLSMYEFKYYQLMDNSLISWLIGNGAGSDLVETDFWWWEAKGAHSDVITFLVEGGIVFFIAFIFMLKNLSLLVPDDSGRSIVLALFVTSLFSNGFFVRPLALYFVLFSIALLYAKEDSRSRVAS